MAPLDGTRHCEVQLHLISDSIQSEHSAGKHTSSESTISLWRGTNLLTKWDYVQCSFPTQLHYIDIWSHIMHIWTHHDQGILLMKKIYWLILHSNWLNWFISQTKSFRQWDEHHHRLPRICLCQYNLIKTRWKSSCGSVLCPVRSLFRFSTIWS